ncbi:MAG: XdhC family protein [Steroidobacteraceae bacterium]
MQSSISPLLRLFEDERAAQRPAVLAVVTQTAGSTYSKPGGLMLIAADGRFAGLLSGGCVEGDLREHARAVIESGVPRTVSYDMRGPDDLLFGLGAGCEGAMDIFLQPIGPATGWKPLAFFADCAARGRSAAVAFIVESRTTEWPVGSMVQSDGTAARDVPMLVAATRDASASRRAGWFEDAELGIRAFVAVLSLPPRVLLLGGGPDAEPVTELASFLGWKTTVVDHRAAYANAERFPRAERVLCVHPDDARGVLALEEFDAAIVMSHHLTSDLGWLRLLAAAPIPYVGLLGPAARRERLLADLGADAASLRARLRAPIGLDLGGRSPESIALSIVAEIHAVLEGRAGWPFSQAGPS